TASRWRQLFIRSATKKVSIKGQGDEQLSAITKSKREERARDERGRSHQGKIESCSLSQQSKAESDLPRAAEPEVASRPRPKNGRQRKQNRSNQSAALEPEIIGSECLCELKKEINTSTGNQRCQSLYWKLADQSLLLHN